MAKVEKKQASQGKGLLLLALGFAMLLCLFSFRFGNQERNWLGLIGYGVGWGLHFLLGLGSFLLAFYLGWLGWRSLSRPEEEIRSKSIYFLLFLISSCLLLNLAAEITLLDFSFLDGRVYTESLTVDTPYPHRYIRYNLGGVPLYYLFRDLPHFNLQILLSNVGIAFTFSILAAVSFFLATDIDLLLLLKKTRTLFKPVLEKWIHTLQKPSLKEITERLSPPPSLKNPSPKMEEIRKEVQVMKKVNLPELSQKKESHPAKAYSGDYTSYQLPPISLLTSPQKVDHPTIKKDLKRQAEILEETLASFGIEGKVGEIHCGPTITSFEVHPAVGVKVQKIKTLENDIALNLQAKSIRIIAPIPGKAAVGVEIPSLYPQEVSFKEMLSSYTQGSKKLFIPLLLGKTVTGENVISDLARMPHCLIAGATGSGKSVCINTLVMSIVMNARPDEIKLLMIDPKKVELTSYTRLPHLIAPVITEPRGAYAALQWLVKEMLLRYDILKQLGLRNIQAFNHRTINAELEASLSMPIPKRMPAIVAIIDEFADLMMASSSDLETPIARIAQMARAVGIHLVLATQRPSREVITGLIKANFPTRIAFKVANRINSQIILDENGAESLLGNGDMLFLPPGTSHILRAQGAYLSDDDINRVISFIEEQAAPRYLIESFDNLGNQEITPLGEDSNRDALYDQALTIVLETKNASTTFLQRKLKIGYARAASLIDELEINGVVAPQEGARPRRILATHLPPKNSFPSNGEIDN